MGFDNKTKMQGYYAISHPNLGTLLFADPTEAARYMNLIAEVEGKYDAAKKLPHAWLIDKCKHYKFMQVGRLTLSNGAKITAIYRTIEMLPGRYLNKHTGSIISIEHAQIVVGKTENGSIYSGYYAAVNPATKELLYVTSDDAITAKRQLRSWLRAHLTKIP